MPKFISIPTEIEAIQYNYPDLPPEVEPHWDDNSEEVENWLWDHEPEQFKVEESIDAQEWWRWVSKEISSGAYNEGNPEVYDYIQKVWIPVNNHDWIICGTRGEFYPCADDVFKQKYKEIPE